MHVGGARSASRKFHGSGWAADLADDLEPVFGCGGGFGLGRRYSVRDGEYCQEYDGEYGKESRFSQDDYLVFLDLNMRQFEDDDKRYGGTISIIPLTKRRVALSLQWPESCDIVMPWENRDGGGRPPWCTRRAEPARRAKFHSIPVAGPRPRPVEPAPQAQ